MSDEVRNILVIDDQESARTTIKAILSSPIYRVDLASSGDEGLAMMAVQRYDLVLCDVMMPRMSGFEVCRAIKAHEEWRLTPVIMVSALNASEDIAAGLDAGADDFVSRPFEVPVFRARVRACLRVRTTFDELSSQKIDVNEMLRKRRERIVIDAALSARETEVLDLIVLGRTHQDISDILGITPRTSKFHLHNILAKLGAESRADLLRIFT